jgi:hypothetical protein
MEENRITKERNKEIKQIEKGKCELKVQQNTRILILLPNEPKDKSNRVSSKKSLSRNRNESTYPIFIRKFPTKTIFFAVHPRQSPHNSSKQTTVSR